MSFFNITNFILFFRNSFKVSNGLDPDQDRRSVGPGLGPNSWQRFSADDKSRRKQGKSQIQTHDKDTK